MAPWRPRLRKIQETPRTFSMKVSQLHVMLRYSDPNVSPGEQDHPCPATLLGTLSEHSLWAPGFPGRLSAAPHAHSPAPGRSHLLWSAHQLALWSSQQSGVGSGLVRESRSLGTPSFILTHCNTTLAKPLVAKGKQALKYNHGVKNTDFRTLSDLVW